MRPEPRVRGGPAARIAGIALGALLAASLAGGCAKRPPAPVPPPQPPAGPREIDAAVSDVASGGAWEEGGRSGIYRVVVRGGGKQTPRSEVTLEWLRWDAKAEQPIEERRVRIREIARGGIVVTNSRLDQEDGRTVVKLGLANPYTGATGEARIWPTAVGRYRVKLKWTEAR